MASGETRCTNCGKPENRHWKSVGLPRKLSCSGALDDLRVFTPAASSAIEVAPQEEPFCNEGYGWNGNLGAARIYCFRESGHSGDHKANTPEGGKCQWPVNYPRPSVAPGEAQREPQPKDDLTYAQRLALGETPYRGSPLERIDKLRARITELEETLRKIVDICTVTDPCPYFGTGEYQNHSSGDCIQCKARAALAGTPSGKEGKDEISNKAV